MTELYDADAVMEQQQHGRLSRSPSPTLIYPLPAGKLAGTGNLNIAADISDGAESFPFDPVDTVLDCSQNSLGALSSAMHRSLSRSPEGRRVRQRRRRSSRESSATQKTQDQVSSTTSTPVRSTVVTDIDQAMAELDEVKLKARFGDSLNLSEKASPVVSPRQMYSSPCQEDAEETNIDDEPPSAKMMDRLRQRSLEAELHQDAAVSPVSSSTPHEERRARRERRVPAVSFDEAVAWPVILPDELNMKNKQMFDGETLASWLCSQFDESHYLHVILTRHDFRVVTAQFCTHLLSAGVLHSVGSQHRADLFKAQNQYRWGGQDSSQVTAIAGHDHCTQDVQSRGQPSDVWSGSHRSQEIWPPRNTDHSEPHSDERKHGLAYTEADVQAQLAQLRREYQAQEEQLKRDHKEEMGRMREGFIGQIERLSEQILDLQDELKKYKTLAGIDQLTKEALQAAEAASQEVGFHQDSMHAPDLLLAVTGTPSHRQESQQHLPDSSSKNLQTTQSDSSPPPIPALPTSLSDPSASYPAVTPPAPPPPPPPPPSLDISSSSLASPACPPPPPPPPSLGGLPLPPPPPPLGGPGLALRKEPLKPIISPRSPMKPLFWKRIQVYTVKSHKTKELDSNDLFWEQIEEEPLNFEQFEELFAKVPVEPKKKSNANKAKPKTVQPAKVIPPKRSQAVGILLSSLRLEFSDIEDAILNLDTSILDVEKFKAIYDNRPDDEEMKLIRSQLEKDGDIPLDKPEQFLYDLEQIPFFADRIFCFIFQSSFQESMTSIDSKLNNLKMTCQFLSSYESVKRIFGLILACGNYMNGGSRTRGQADGFDLEILPKLKDVKGKDNRTSLLQFLVSRYVQKYDTDIMGTDRAKLPLPDPSDIQQASLVNFEDIHNELRKIRKDFNSAESKANNIVQKSSQESLEPFKSVMNSFFDKGRQDLQEQEDNLRDCSTLFDSTCTFFYVKPKTNEKVVTPEHFFSLWLSFCSDFKDIWKKEQQAVTKLRIKEAEERVRSIKESKMVLPPTRAKKIGGLKDKLSRQGKI